MNSLFRFILSIIFLVTPWWLFPEGMQPKGEINVVNFDQLQSLLQWENDTVYVVNFWATWCAPCIEEIPSFEKLGEKYRNKNLKVLMVSLDNPKELHSRLIPFVQKEKMKNEVILLDDPGSNRWIPLVDENWTGVIPASLIYGKGFRHFYQQEFTFEELDSVLQTFNAFIF